MPTSVSVFGLGLMGRPIARTLAGKGFRVTGWNRSALDPALTQGIPLSQALEDAAASEVCLLMLSDSDAVDAVLASLGRYLKTGQVLVDMGTSDPSRSKTHAARLAGKGIGWVDAPVSGGPEGAVSGTLAIMAGGTKDHVARVRPILEALGTVVHVGSAGAGHVVKVLNQVIVGLTIEAVAEALSLAERSGIDPRLVQAALRGGFADSKVLQIHGTRMIERAYTPGGKVRTQLKDLRLALRLAEAAQVALPHTESAAARYQALVDQGDGDLDHSALHKLLAR
ncbi:MAG TPA: NAD(P)-dependent oxidoreductase [bacterium]|nr:NAD(P)-dependent oxidoreductase [bacterium]